MRRDRYGFGAGVAGYIVPPSFQPHFGLTIVSCGEADFRPSANGLLIYAKAGVTDMASPGAGTFSGQINLWDDCYAAIVEAKPPLHDGQFARETLRIFLAMLESAHTQSEITLKDFPPS